jgi:hypothetical protein
MPITNNVAWDGRLNFFKGPDSSHYVRSAASTATSCFTCGQSLVPGEPLSMSVEVSEGNGPNGSEYRTFDCCVCHRACCVPGLTVRESTGMPEELKSVAAMMTLHYEDTAGRQTLPVLVFTLLPNLTFGVPGGEFTSVLVSALLAQGFQLATNGVLESILQEAEDVRAETYVTLRQGLLVLHVGGEAMYSRHLDPAEPSASAWLAAAGCGRVLVIGGDHLLFTQAGVQLSGAAALGTLAIGTVLVRS